MAPFVNIVFVCIAVLAQLFLSTSWGRAASAWTFPWSSSYAKGEKAGHKLDAEKRRLLAAGPSGGSQLYSDSSNAQTETRTAMPTESPGALYVELTDAHHLLNQHDNLQRHQS